MIIIADYELILGAVPSKPCIMKKSIHFPILLSQILLNPILLNPIPLSIIMSITLTLITSTTFAQTDSLVKFVNPPSVSSPKGFSQAVQIDLGNCKMLMISGQVAFDQQGNLIGKANFSEQATQVFNNIKSIIEAQGGKMNNLVRISIYLTDISQLAAFREVRDQFINIKCPPASTLVQVNRLFRDDVLLEVDATAIIPNTNPIYLPAK
jgi:2-iminobutanoate/2-iminopropanoate deaminase